MNELNYTFYSLKSNKIPGKDNISFNLIKKCFDSLCEYWFNLSIGKGVFSEVLKLTRATTIYKDEGNSDVSN